MKLFAIVSVFVGLAMAVAVPNPAADNLEQRACRPKDSYCAANEVCCNSCINPLGPAGGVCS